MSAVARGSGRGSGDLFSAHRGLVSPLGSHHRLLLSPMEVCQAGPWNALCPTPRVEIPTRGSPGAQRHGRPGGSSPGTPQPDTFLGKWACPPRTLLLGSGQPATGHSRVGAGEPRLPGSRPVPSSAPTHLWEAAPAAEPGHLPPQRSPDLPQTAPSPQAGKALRCPGGGEESSRQGRSWLGKSPSAWAAGGTGPCVPLSTGRGPGTPRGGPPTRLTCGFAPG